MDFCVNIDALRTALIREINSSGLTIGAATLVVKDVYNTLYLTFLEEKEKELKRKNVEVTHEEVIFDKPIEIQEEVTENGNENNE